MNRPPSSHPGVHGDRQVAITYLTPERFAAKPQIGIPITQEWHSLVRWLTWPIFANAKQAAGAWSPCALPGGRVDGGKGPVSLLVADVDVCLEGAIARHAESLAPYAGAIIPSFSATVERPKHRIVLLLSRALEADEFPLAWGKMARTFAHVGIVVDPACKNINRLWFPPVAKSPNAWLGARLLLGDPVPVDAMLEVARQEEDDAARERSRLAKPRPVADRNRDRYIAGAIDRARANVGGANEGNRHHTLLQEAFALARFGLDELAVTDALLEPFVAAAGEGRRREGEKAIRDAVAARNTGAA